MRLLQLTDLHLYAEPERLLLGQCTRSTFEQVLAQAQRQHWPPDAILFTGDLVHDERVEGYRYLRRMIDRIDCPCFCLPGNHDRLDLLTEVDPGADQACRLEPLGPWDLLLLDSTIAGSEGGRLRPDTLERLAQHLAAAPQRPALIGLHHQPVPVGSRWIDTMQIENGAALMALAERHPRLRAILCGHVHQAFDRQRGHIRLLATPSTCAQFKPGSDDFALDDRPPGYRWLELEPDGSLHTGIERLASKASGEDDRARDPRSPAS
ncbi:3',5'-cyclic-AMP phosphodiesterase [Halochromatium salexigens]|uniref:3',5'-cyclic-AMP phosphodiesterase n=1 Tax=Halochromatium salexigens TaxID=49447 RepID=A0AAJ0XG04_HALSE|nr:3',5'-cyclic-AMP phosphodiesterase [Halochromatium salexigens]MBK5931574.1 3',5'-cyclic-AMP phosphodiesterase [Halochromatium salexigens]